MVEEAYRLTKPGGKVLIIEWNDVKTTFGPTMERRISEQQALKLATDTKLVLEQKFKPGPYHFGLIFKK
ncbi:MAG: hypothetical protein RLZZ69_1102 [Cyanobacteriota bacterium]